MCPSVDRGLLDFFRTGKHVTQTTEVHRVGLARIPVEKSIGADHDGAISMIEHGWHYPVVKRRWIKGGVKAADHREQRAHRKAKTMEERQRVEDAVPILHVTHAQHLPDVCQQVGMGKLNPLRGAFRAAGEEDYRSGTGGSRSPDCGLRFEAST